MAKYVPGQTLSSKKGNEYKIIRYLGEGVTAQVYEAERTTVTDEDARFPVGNRIALKVLQDDLPEDIAASFREEADILSGLLYGSDHSLVPHVVERAFDSDLPQQFLAMELITGQPLDKLIEERGSLTEHEVLLITEQILMVLEKLHTQLRRSYTDFQLQNVWWQAETEQIKVMDWNHVSNRASEGEYPPGASDDLIRLGAYLYQMATGKGALQSGETAHVLAQRVGEEWLEQSVGLRAIICRTLHPNPMQRYHQAAEFRADITRLRDLWQMAEGDLEEEVIFAFRPLRNIQSDERVEAEAVHHAERLVDMLRRRQPDNAKIADYEQQIRTLTDDISARWRSGRLYYRGGAFGDAVQKWQPEAEAIGRIDLWRWVMAARLGEQVDKPTYQGLQDPLERGIERMNQGDWPAAQQSFARINLEPQPEPFKWLINENNAHLQDAAAKVAEATEEWASAAACYRQIPDLIEGIPYVNLLYEIYGWQPDHLQTLANRYDEIAGRAVAENDLIIRLRAIEDIDVLIQEVKTQLIKTPHNPALRDFCLQKASEVGEDAPGTAVKLLTTLLQWANLGHQRAPIFQNLQQARQRVDEQQATERTERLQAVFQQNFDSGLSLFITELKTDPAHTLFIQFVSNFQPPNPAQRVALIDALLQWGRWGERETQLRAMLHEAKTAQQAAENEALRQRIQQAFQINFEQGMAQVATELQATSHNPALIALCKQEAAQRPTTEAIELLTLLLEKADIGAAKPELEQLLEQQRSKQAVLETEMRRQEQLGELSRQAEEAYNKGEFARLYEIIVQLQVATPPSLIGSVQDKYKEMLAQKALPLARLLADILQAASVTGNDERRDQLGTLEQELAAINQQWEDDLPALVEQDIRAGRYEDARRKIEAARLRKNDPQYLRQVARLDPFLRVEEYLSALGNYLEEPTFEREEWRKLYDKARQEVDSLPENSRQSLRRRLAELRLQMNKRHAEQLFKEAAAELAKKRPDFGAAYQKLAGAEGLFAHLDDQAGLAKAARLKEDLEQEQAKKDVASVGSFTPSTAELTTGSMPTLTEATPTNTSLEIKQPIPSPILPTEGMDELIRAMQQQVGDRVRRQIGIAVLLLTIIGIGIGAVITLLNLQNNAPDMSVQLTEVAALHDSVADLTTAVADDADRFAQFAMTAEAQNAGIEQNLETIVASLTVREPMAEPTLEVPEVTNTPEPTDTPTPEPMPIPLPVLVLTTIFISPSIPDQEDSFYDVPDMILTMPQGWEFATPEGGNIGLIERSIPDVTWELHLVYTHTLPVDEANATPNTDPKPPEVQSMSINAAQVSYQANILTITWSLITTTAPFAPGAYIAQWQIVHEDNVQVATQFSFIVQEPFALTVAQDKSYRILPEWARVHNVDESSGISVEVLGKRGVPLTVLSTREGALFFLVRVPGTRETYWLGDQDTAEFNQTVGDLKWAEMIEKIPNV